MKNRRIRNSRPPTRASGESGVRSRGNPSTDSCGRSGAPIGEARSRSSRCVSRAAAADSTRGESVAERAKSPEWSSHWRSCDARYVILFATSSRESFAAVRANSPLDRAIVRQAEASSVARGWRRWGVLVRSSPGRRDDAWPCIRTPCTEHRRPSLTGVADTVWEPARAS